MANYNISDQICFISIIAVITFSYTLHLMHMDLIATVSAINTARKYVAYEMRNARMRILNEQI